MNDAVSSVLSPKLLTFKVLRLLSDGKFHSGQDLAQQLGMSRTSVNNALRDVARYDLVLHSIRGKGYRLANPPQWLEVEKIRTELGEAGKSFHIQLLDIAPSSNTLLMQQARQGAPSGRVLAVEFQTAGRGRLGRAWHGSLGNTLTFSLLWRFETGLAALSGLSLAVGLAMLRALGKLGIHDIGLKWPNDVQTSQGKLAGILIEAQGDMLGPSVVVIGIGMNQRLTGEMAGRLEQPASSLLQVVDELPERNRLFAVLLAELESMLETFSLHGFAPMRAEWEQNHRYHGKQARLIATDGTSIVGVVSGVTDSGELRFITGQGEQIFNAGELSLRSELC